MQPLASDNTSNFHRAALNAGCGEQHLTQRAIAQLGEPTTAAPQGRRWNQRPGENPGPITAEKLHLARPGPGIQTQAQDARFIPAGMTPALTEYAHLEVIWTTLAQPPSQRTGVK